MGMDGTWEQSVLRSGIATFRMGRDEDDDKGNRTSRQPSSPRHIHGRDGVTVTLHTHLRRPGARHERSRHVRHDPRTDEFRNVRPIPHLQHNVFQLDVAMHEAAGVHVLQR